MDVNFNQFDLLQKLIAERQDDSRQLNAISQQVQSSQKIFDLEFNQVQQSLRQMGFKIIAMKKQDKLRQEEENRTIDIISKIPSLNLPERMYIYKFCHNVIKLFRPDMQIIRFNQKDSRDLLLMFKQFFMAENNFESLHIIQSFMEQEFKMALAIVLIKQLLNRSREEFCSLIQTTSAVVISKIKSKIAEHMQQQQITESHQQTEQTESPQTEKPRLLVVKRSSYKNNISSDRKLVFRSVSMIESKIPKPVQQVPIMNPETELKLQLRAEQRQLRKSMIFACKPMDLDNEHQWASYIVLKKKFFKHPDSYFLSRGGFFLWCQLKNNNSYIRQGIQNYYFQATKIISQDRLKKDQMYEIHHHYNKYQVPHKQQKLHSQSPSQSNSPQKQQRSQIFPQLAQNKNNFREQFLKPLSLYDPLRDMKEQAQYSFKSLNLSQDQM